MNEQTQKWYKIDSKRLKRKKREPHPPTGQETGRVWVWVNVTKHLRGRIAKQPHSVDLYVTMWSPGRDTSSTSSPDQLELRLSCSCCLLKASPTRHNPTQNPHTTLFSLSHVVFTSASSHLNCTGSSLKGAVGARPSPDLRRIILTWITVETPTLYAWDDRVYWQLPPTEKTRRTAVWPERKACKWGCDFITSVGLMLSLH